MHDDNDNKPTNARERHKISQSSKDQVKLQQVSGNTKTHNEQQHNYEDVHSLAAFEPDVSTRSFNPSTIFAIWLVVHRQGTGRACAERRVQRITVALNATNHTHSLKLVSDEKVETLTRRRTNQPIPGSHTKPNPN